MNKLSYVKCIICEEDVENMTYEDMPATIHPVDGTYVDIIICNNCLQGHKEKYLYEGRKV